MYYKRSPRVKDEVITFKVGGSLARVIRRLPNRSEFIREAVLAALDHACPLCQGSGILTPEQKRHWDAFASGHTLSHCSDCDGLLLACGPGRRAR